MCHGPVFDLSDAQFLKVVTEAKSLKEIATQLGIKSTKGIQTRLKTIPIESSAHLGSFVAIQSSRPNLPPISKIKIHLKVRPTE
jgi:hypothetical protein